MRAIRVHDLDHARAALAAGRAAGCGVTLLSPVGLQYGIGWWRALALRMREEFPDVPVQAVLDCGPSAGLALAAIRSGAGPVLVDAPPDLLAKLDDIATQAGTLVIKAELAVLDLQAMHDAVKACREWLAAQHLAKDHTNE